VRNPAHVQRYSNLVVQWIDHHNPDLILFDTDGQELNRIDMTRLSSTAAMHKLMVLLGMNELCQDDHSSCESWAGSGECLNNPVFMKDSCRKSCGSCSENATVVDSSQAGGCRDVGLRRDCEYWSTMGECTGNEGWMREKCARACGFCSDGAEEPKDEL